MKNLRGKNIKCAVLLSITSIMGIQGGEADYLKCPSYAAVLASEKHEPGQKFAYHYQVTVKGPTGRSIVFASNVYHPLSRSQPTKIVAAKWWGNQRELGCVYTLPDDDGKEYLVSRDAGAFNDCDSNSGDALDSFFCNESVKKKTDK